MELQLFFNVSLILAINAAILFSIYMLISFLRLKKRKQPFEELHQKLTVGKNVLLASGLYGKVLDIKDEVVQIEIAPKVIIKASRFAIQSIVEE
jgi:preprotein translocase subunit YajC